MSSQVDNVIKNFKWVIESIAPTNLAVNKKFFWSDDLRTPDNISSGMSRAFNVRWESRGADLEISDITERYSECVFTVEVAYSTKYGTSKLMEIMPQDSHDLIKALRDDALFTGISTNTVLDVGLHLRSRESEKIETSGSDVWYIKQTWSCVIKESEI